MSTLGYLFILLALIITRQVFKGRVMNVGEDLSDAFLAIVSGNSNALTEVFARTGSSNASSGPSGSSDPKVGSGSGLAAAAIDLGSKAKGYRWTATGPEYYDCSGLIWRAAQRVGFRGVRFTTSTIQLSKQFVRTDNPGIDDVVCWPAHHMGVITGPDKFYSARNPTVGISEATISTFRTSNPIYFRFVR